MSGYRGTGSHPAEELVRITADIEGRLLGPVPADATRRSEVDVLAVHTTG